MTKVRCTAPSFPGIHKSFIPVIERLNSFSFCRPSEKAATSSTNTTSASSVKSKKSLTCGKAVNSTQYDHLRGIANRHEHPHIPEPEVAMIFRKKGSRSSEVDLNELEEKLLRLKKEVGAPFLILFQSLRLASLFTASLPVQCCLYRLMVRVDGQRCRVACVSCWCNAEPESSLASVSPVVSPLDLCHLLTCAPNFAPLNITWARESDSVRLTSYKGYSKDGA